MTPAEPSAAEILEERISDAMLKRNNIPVVRQQAWLDAGWLAMQTVFTEAIRGNAECARVSKEILALLPK